MLDYLFWVIYFGTNKKYKNRMKRASGFLSGVIAFYSIMLVLFSMHLFSPSGPFYIAGAGSIVLALLIILFSIILVLSFYVVPRRYSYSKLLEIEKKHRDKVSHFFAKIVLWFLVFSMPVVALLFIFFSTDFG